MRIVTIVFVSLFLACAGNGSGITLTTSFGRSVLATQAPTMLPLWQI